MPIKEFKIHLAVTAVTRIDTDKDTIQTSDDLHRHIVTDIGDNLISEINMGKLDGKIDLVVTEAYRDVAV